LASATITDPSATPADESSSADTKTTKSDPAWGAWVVIAGLAAIVIVFGIAVLKYKTAADVTTAVGAVSGVIAALVGAYFGIRGATLAQTNAESPNDAKKKTHV
jgi:uncharacterized membrane protein YdcZ (DUF606 family)